MFNNSHINEYEYLFNKKGGRLIIYIYYIHICIYNLDYVEYIPFIYKGRPVKTSIYPKLNTYLRKSWYGNK